MRINLQPVLNTMENHISKREIKRRRQKAEHDRKAAKAKEKTILDKGKNKLNCNEDY